jgi:endonuclease/exonuclease/phosphatase family metal-dependent hydrolase
MVTWVKLRDRTNPEAGPIAFFNTHFDHRGPKSRIEAARLIRKKIEEFGVGCRIVLTGDFNSGDGSDPYKTLFADPKGLRDTYRHVNATKSIDEGTTTGFKAGISSGGRIDWIGCSPDWEIKDASIVRVACDGRTPSDHHAVTAILGTAKPVSADKATLRVLCYNIHHGEGTDGKVDLPRLARVIHAAMPDFVALQEVDRNVRRSGSVDQSAELAKLTGLHGAFAKAIDYDGGEYGQAILSRFPIERLTIHHLPGEPEREQRIAAEVLKPLGVTNYRLVAPQGTVERCDDR